MTPSQRRQRARLGGLSVHAKYGSDRIAARARRGLLARFEREADPDGRLTPEEREHRGRLLLRAHMTRIAMKSAKARRKRSRAPARG